MKKVLITLALVSIATVGFLAWRYLYKAQLKSPAGSVLAPITKPLEKYTIANLSKAEIQSSQIEIGDMIKEEPGFNSRYFFFKLEGKKVSGLINIPNKPGTYPVIIMLRGYVDKENYQTGIGTQRAGEYFAQNGIITIAPDFLGYGQSDKEAENSIESRFQTYTTVLTLLASIRSLNSELSTVNSQPKADSSRTGLWGHSNGGQIALTVLEITGKPYPTVLWAPVSKPFPYSILYYTDDFDDHGKALRRAIADFEKDYDIELYSLTNYLDKISAPLELHQGTADDAVPQKWSDALVENLKKHNKDIEYFIYPGADHNLLGGWNLAAGRSLGFFKNKLGN